MLRIFVVSIILIVALSAASAPVEPAPGVMTLRAGQPVCNTEALLDEFLQAEVIDKDIGAVHHLLSNGCAVSIPGLPVSVIEHAGWDSSKAHIRIRIADWSGEAWTVTPALVQK